MSLEMYGLDRYAHNLVSQFCSDGVLSETHDMRATAAFGLERFFGEQIRLKDKKEGKYWRKTWDALVQIMDDAGIEVPTLQGNNESTQKEIQNVIEGLWDEEKFPRDHRKITLAVLIQLCDSMVWWAQRYKKFSPQTIGKQQKERRS